MIKKPPANAGEVRDVDLIPEWGRPPGRGHGNPLSILAWRIPWTEEPGRLQLIGSHRVRHDWSDLANTKATVCHSKYAQETLLRAVMHLPMASSDHVFFLYFINN